MLNGAIVAYKRTQLRKDTVSKHVLIVFVLLGNSFFPVTTIVYQHFKINNE